MFVFGSKRAAFRPAASGQPSSSAHSSSVHSSTGQWAAARRAAGQSSSPLNERRYELALLVAHLPAVSRADYIQRLLPLIDKRPAWKEDDVGDAPAAQCRCWWPFASERLNQQTPRGLLLVIQTELEGGLRSAATPLWLLNHIVRRVWLLHQGQRIGQAYGELERQLGDPALALEWVSGAVAGLARVGIL